MRNIKHKRITTGSTVDDLDGDRGVVVESSAAHGGWFRVKFNETNKTLWCMEGNLTMTCAKDGECGHHCTRERLCYVERKG